MKIKYQVLIYILLIIILYCIYHSIKSSNYYALVFSLLSIFIINPFFFEKYFIKDGNYDKGTFLTVVSYFIFLGIFGFISTADESRRIKSLGFDSRTEYDAAIKIGAANKSEYQSKLNVIRIEEETRRIKEQKANEEKIALEKQKKDAAQAIAEEACRKDISCIGDRKSYSAGRLCKPYIQSLAKYDIEWTDGLFDMKFDRFRWKNNSKKIITFIGDKVKFQNGFGAWSNMVYFCDIDIESNAVTGVSAQAGRLN
ncbi:hypothetical protein FSY45_08795 [Comamonas sp. Z1]|uniref:hypothetical protein n=1 Tax=Comamonas sp. Z1 TaxID=2601246 RepID=UPI0011E76D80|nr:hypothetical protein [Comamonas sp. Z1]TYK76711.1 hypothetical protein FSY45_08795 [Comamonas sp. Z1]